MAKILYAEDDKDLRETGVEVFKRAGFKVEAFENGEQALAWLLGHSCDIVVTDGQMPRMDGYELARAVKQYDRHIPVIMFGGQAQSMLPANVDVHVLKKEGFEKLIASIRNIL